MLTFKNENRKFKPRLSWLLFANDLCLVESCLTFFVVKFKLASRSRTDQISRYYRSERDSVITWESLIFFLSFSRSNFESCCSILSENMSDSKEIEGDPYDLPDPDLKIILLGVSSSCIRPNFAFWTELLWCSASG